MKKILCILSILSILFVISFSYSFASNANVPTYDPDFNNGAGAFYANGTDIIIRENEQGNTIIYWDNGEQEVSSTVFVFGGGNEGSDYTTSHITMDSGKIAFLYGGGISLTEGTLSKVTTSSITINAGTITNTVYGGGLIYSQVGTSNVTVNGGTISAVNGGGAASATINGISYSAGSKENPQNSKNRVDITNLTINNGTINSEQFGYGLVYGGGQGYSYTGKVNLIINGGDMKNAYVTAGGSNGYTGQSDVKITGGDIKIYQSVNRGTVENVQLKTTGGNIDSLFIGGETTDPTVTGTLKQADIALLGGNVINLEKGTSDGKEITIDENAYSLVYVKETVQNNHVGQQEKQITYQIEVNPKFIEMYEQEKQKLKLTITTNPIGYESLFENESIIWKSSNTEVATVDQKGTINAIQKGNATITATLIDKQDVTEVTVLDSNLVLLIIGIILVVLVIIISLFIWISMLT